MRKWLLLALLLFPVVALAANGSIGLFQVDPNDKSMEYLGAALGNVPGTPIQGETNPLVGSLFYVFNQVVFVLGILIIIYTTVVGTMHTAQEGQFLGKNWHPVLVPLRAALGIFLLLPTSTGYNWIQITVIWFIVQGVGAANALWKQMIVSNQSQGNLHADTRKVNLLDSNGTVSSIFNSNVCMITLNDNPDSANLLGEKITVFQWGNQIQWGRFSHAGQEQPLCGSITIPPVGAGIGGSNSNASSQADGMAAAIMAAQATLTSAATEAVNGGGTNTVGLGAFTSAANLLQTSAQNMQTSVESLDEINQEAIQNGWILAGSYYFQLVQGGAGPTISINYAASSPDTQAMNTILGQSVTNQTTATMGASASTYSTSTSKDVAASSKNKNGKLKLSGDTGTNPQVSSILAMIFGDLMDQIVDSINNEITTGGKNNDPILSMASFGSNLVGIVELTFWGALALVLAAWMVSSLLSCINPLGHTLDFILSMIIPIAVMMLSFLYLAGITLALYIPLIPYLVFTFCAIGWLILVIEALMGASLIGLTLVVPSEDEIGKAGHAFVILLGLFLRPALMILGYILAIQLLSVAVKMLNFGFWETLVASTGVSEGVGIFAMVAVLLMYVAIATTLTHESFSLIYVVPNKVLRWMGGGPEGDEDVMSKVKESKGNVEKGGGIAKGAMSGALTKFAAKNK